MAARAEEPFTVFLRRAFAAGCLASFVVAWALVVCWEELLDILATVLALPFFAEAGRTGFASMCWVKQRIMSSSGVCRPQVFRHFFPIACLLLFWRSDDNGQQNSTFLPSYKVGCASGEG